MTRKFIRCASASFTRSAALVAPRPMRSVSKKQDGRPAGPTLKPRRVKPWARIAASTMDALSDPAQAIRAVIAGIHRGHVGQQRLGGADVAGGLLAADVLLAGLQGEPQGGAAARILGDPDDPAGHLALESVARGEKRRVRAAVAQRHAEALRAAEGDVRAEFARRSQQRQAEQIRRDGHQRARGMGLLDEAGVVEDFAVGVRVLHQRPEDLVAELKSLVVADDHLDAERRGAGLDHINRLRVAVCGDEERCSGRL